jgi:polysaccharide export outer membrane protein
MSSGVPSLSQQSFPPPSASAALSSQAWKSTNASSLKLPLSAAGPISVPEDFSKLKIAPGFLLKVDVYDTPELSGDFRVDDAGDIAFPLIGPVHVADKTLAETKQALESQFLAKKVLNYPQVTVNVEQYAPFVVAVTGEVQTPGRVQLLAPHSLLDLISYVGGETELAGGEIQVRHEVDGKIQSDTYHYDRLGDGGSIASVMIHNGDTVIVPRAGIVYVLGAVTRPGGYVMQERGSLDVAQALSLAMGTTMQARVGDIHVVRRKPDGTWVEIPVNYNEFATGKQVPLSLEAEDIVYVPVSKLKAVFTSGGAIISAATYATVYGLK